MVDEDRNEPGLLKRWLSYQDEIITLSLNAKENWSCAGLMTEPAQRSAKAQVGGS